MTTGQRRDQQPISRAVGQPVQDRSKKTQQALLDALERLLAEKTINELTVAQIAAEAGVTTGAIYRRFKDKKDLLHAAFDRFLEETADTGHQEASRRSTPSDEAILRDAFWGVLNYTLDHIPLMRAAASYNDMPSHNRMREARNLMAERLAARLTTSPLPQDELVRRTRFTMRMVTAVIRDTFMTGPAALDARIPRYDFVKQNKAAIDRLIDDLLDMAAAHLQIQPVEDRRRS